MIKKLYHKIRNKIIQPCIAMYENQSFQINDLKVNFENQQNQQNQLLHEMQKTDNALKESYDCLNKKLLETKDSYDNTIKYFADTMAEKSYMIDQQLSRIKQLELEITRLKMKCHSIETKGQVGRAVQVVPVLKSGDAIGNYACLIDKMLRKEGIPTCIMTYENNGDYELVEVIDDYPKLRSDDIMILHMGAENAMADLVDVCDCKKVLFYHNITPPSFFEDYNQFAYESTRNGYMQTERMSSVIDFCITVSEYNKEELIRMGYKCPIEVVSIPIDLSRFDNEKSVQINKEGKRFLFVGRIAPNKKIEDIIFSYESYVSKYDSDVTLFIVGGYDEDDLYYQYLASYIEKNELKNVILTGKVSDKELADYYQSADLFLCMSEHEGFCVPLLEAMYHHIPIIAYDAGAVGETLENGGILVKEKNSDDIADIINNLMNDKNQLNNIYINQNIILEKRNDEVSQKRLLDIIQKIRS